MGGVPPFQVEIIREEGTIRLVLIGELDISTASILEERLREAEAERASRLVLDLTKLEFMDSSGLGVIFASHARHNDRQDRLLLIPGPPHVQRVFELSGLDSHLHFVEDGAL